MSAQTMQEIVEMALIQLAATPAFRDIALAFPYAEVYLQIQNGQYISGDVRIKGRGERRAQPAPDTPDTEHQRPVVARRGPRRLPDS
ncbi:MAG: hypothetical protein KIT87_28325 [Anaerolineae bacterium]|nr:hypothetical protein [Anaerolineae bacterium]